MRKNLRIITFAFLLLALASSCEKDYIKEGEDESAKSSGSDRDNTSGLHEDSTDYVWDPVEAIPIVLNGNSISANSASVGVSGNIATIYNAGTYSISGSLTNGQLVVNTSDTDVVRILLTGAQITNTSGATFLVSKAGKVVIYLQPGFQNVFADASSYANVQADAPNACIYSKSNLTIFGKGSLVVKGNYQDGISCKDGLIVKDGTIDISSVDDGINGKDYVYLRGSRISIKAGGDGLKSDNVENAALGYILLTDDTLDITSSGDAISAQTLVTFNSGAYTLTSGGGSSKTIASNLSAKGIKADTRLVINGGNFAISAADDALHTNGALEINNGEISLSSSDDGIKAEGSAVINNGKVTITKSYEGIECPSIKVNDGNLSIVASDDGFNATKGNGGEANDGSLLSVAGGYVYVNVTGGDGLDSNGNISISGGTVVVHGPQSSPEVGMDYNGTCVVTGGSLVISGTNSNMTQAPSTSSSQYSLKVMMTSSLAANTLFHIQDANGNDVLTFKPSRLYYSIVYSSPLLKNGNTYYIYTGGSSTGTLNNGLYQGGVYSGGTLCGNFTVTSSVTTLGSSSGGGWRPGG